MRGKGDGSAERGEQDMILDGGKRTQPLRASRKNGDFLPSNYTSILIRLCLKLQI